jgi:3-deoxy-7-phosphoheptulonate synthase
LKPSGFRGFFILLRVKREKEMILVMKPGASEEQVKHAIERVEGLGLKAHVIYGTNRTVVAAIGDKRAVALEALSSVPGVEKLMPVLAPYKLASLEGKPEKTAVELTPDFRMGGKRVGVIAGPCTVEDREMLLEVAHVVKEEGAVGLRGGAFKPRTNPYTFQGLMEEGLEYLAEAREKTGLAIVTEAMSVEHVQLVQDYADVIQIGARNMHNFVLLKAAGEAKKPVLLKRGWGATASEFLLAAEYILSAGNRNVILCERGIRTFEDHTRNTLSLSTVPFLHEQTHLPVVVDPSHATGKSSLVVPMSRAAVACGADGLLVEVHPDPESALTDGGQSLDLEAFRRMMRSLRKVAGAIGREL